MKAIAKIVNFFVTAFLFVFPFIFIFSVVLGLRDSGGDLTTMTIIVLLLPVFATAFVLVQRKNTLLASAALYFATLLLGIVSGVFDGSDKIGFNELYLLIPCALAILKYFMLKADLIKESKNAGFNKTPVVTVRGNETYDLSNERASFSVWNGRVAIFYDDIEVLTVALNFGRGLMQTRRMEAFSYDQIVDCSLHKTRRRGLAIDAYENIYVQLVVNDYQVPSVYVSFLEGSANETKLITRKALYEADQFVAKVKLIMRSSKRYHS